MNRIHREGLPSPKPIRLNGNVILMHFLGKNGWAAPQLREVTIKSQKKLRQLYVECALFLRAMWCKARIVHADFSEFNILYVADRVPRLHFIDFGQAVEITAPNAKDLLMRDCANITSFFRKRGLTSYILTPDDLADFVVHADAWKRDKSSFADSKRAGALLQYELSLGRWVCKTEAEHIVAKMKYASA